MKRTVADYKHLVAEWHPTNNGKKIPSDFTYGSGKSAWWVCPNGHEYESIISNRTGRNSGCRTCADQAPKPWAKKISVNGKSFETIQSASDELNIAADTLAKYIKKVESNDIELPTTFLNDTRFRNNKIHQTGSLEHLRDIAHGKGFEKLDNWYEKDREGILPSQFSKFISQKWNGDWVSFLEELYPGIDIEFWRLQRIPLGIWSDHNRVNQYLDWLSHILEFKNLEDWYSLTTQDLLNNFGDGLYKRYLNLYDILVIRFPNEDVLVWKFSKVPSGTWKDKNLHLKYLEHLAVSLDFTKPQDWYRLAAVDFNRNGGGKILAHYETLVDCVRQNFPELNLLPWKFSRSGRKFWGHSKNRRWFLKWMFEQLSIDNLESYYSISERHFEEYGGISALSYHDSSPAKCIIDLMPELGLDFAEFDKSSKGQLNLYRFLKCQFSNVNISYNYKHPDLRFKDSGRKAEIDLFIKEQKLGIEVQGEQHYRPAWGGKEELKNIIKRDKEKRQLFQQAGLTVYEIKQIRMPMAWDKLDQFLNKNYGNLMHKINAINVS